MQYPVRALILASAGLLLTSLSSCCALFEYLGCGPNEPLKIVNYDSPRACIKTLQAALRYQDSRVLYESLSESFKREQRLDALSFAVAWEEMVKRYPYIPALGSAEITAERWAGATRKRFTLETYGKSFELIVEARPSWELGRSTRFDEAEEGEQPPAEDVEVLSAWLSSLDGVVRKIDGERGKIELALRDSRLIGVGPREFSFLRVGWTWKLRSLPGLGSEKNKAKSASAKGSPSTHP